MKRNILLILMLLFGKLLMAQFGTGGEPSTIFDELSYDEVVDLSIEVDLEALCANYRDDTKHKAVLTFDDKSGEQQFWPIKLQLRGKFRRMHCAEIPPLKLYFDKEDLKLGGFAEYNDFKIVNYCLADKEAARELLLKEYMAYKIYNELATESFRVQLLRITYRDIKSGRKTKQLAIMIEDTGLLKKRINAHKFQKPEIYQQSMFDMEQVQTMALFQYMIGNTDWQLNLEKNIKILEQDRYYIVVPYDFDFSGLVNPPYGIPNSKFNRASLLDRVYLGFKDTTHEMEVVIDQFRTKQPAIYELIKSNKQLRAISKKEMLGYLDTFYDGLSIETVTGTAKISE